MVTGHTGKKQCGYCEGLMLPTSTRTAGVTYTSIVGVRYNMLCKLLGFSLYGGTSHKSIISILGTVMFLR